MHVLNEHNYISIESEMLSHGVGGIEGCAVDRPVCILHFKKGNACLRVFTWGEEFKELKVDAWDLLKTCYDK